MMAVRKLDIDQVKTALESGFADADIGALQVAIYVACGGGWIGRLYSEQPKGAYIDARVGKLPYSRKEIENMRQVLVAMAEQRGLDPNNLPEMPKFHNCGVF
jgi:hypothetical protein